MQTLDVTTPNPQLADEELGPLMMPIAHPYLLETISVQPVATGVTRQKRVVTLVRAFPAVLADQSSLRVVSGDIMDLEGLLTDGSLVVGPLLRLWLTDHRSLRRFQHEAT